MKKNISICVLSIMSIFAVVNQGVASTVDLNQFTNTGGGGVWKVDSTGTKVTETADTWPSSMFLSPDNYVNAHITGTFKVNGLSSHDVTYMDAVGLVFGYTNNTGTDPHYYLFDWRGYPDRASAGMFISEVNGTNVDLWTHTGSDIKILYSDVNTQTNPDALNFKGFERYHEYKYALDYNSDGFKLSIDGKSIFNYSNSMESGRFGFFDLSQENVVFSAANVTPNAVPVPASLFLLAPGLVGIVGARRKRLC